MTTIWLSWTFVQSTKGHTLVIPKKGHDYIYDISAQEHQDLWAAAHKVAKLLGSKIECNRVVTMVLGYEVHHTHIHLIPTLSERDVIPFTPISMTQEEIGKLAAYIRIRKIRRTFLQPKK